MRWLDGTRRACRSHRDFDTFEIEGYQQRLAEHVRKSETKGIGQTIVERAVQRKAGNRATEPIEQVSRQFRYTLSFRVERGRRNFRRNSERDCTKEIRRAGA